MDKIILKNAEFYMRIGITEQERSATQLIYLDVIMFLPLQLAGKLDALSLSVDYSDVWKSLSRLSEQQFLTIEALAEKIAGDTLKSFPRIEQIDVEVQKPEAFGWKADYAGVAISRTKADYPV